MTPDPALAARVRRLFGPPVAFIRPLVCIECDGEFIPARVPDGLPRCPGCGVRDAA